MSDIITIFREVRDPREPNARHDLADILFVALAAVLCGAKSCVDMAEFAEDRLEDLREVVDLRHGAPSHDTFSRLFRLLDPAELARAFEKALAAIRRELGSPRPDGVVAIDGKSLRRGYEKGRAFMPPLMVGVFDSQTRLSIAQARAPGGGEVTATLELLRGLVLKGCIVTADALHCHAAMAQERTPTNPRFRQGQGARTAHPRRLSGAADPGRARMTLASVQASASDWLESLPSVASTEGGAGENIDRLLAAGEPIIIPALVERWPIVTVARQGPEALGAYLLARDRGAPVPVMEAPPAFDGRFCYTAGLQDYSFTKRYRPLGETLDRISHTIGQADGPVIAIQMLPLVDQAPAVVRDNPMPLLPADIRPNLWLGGRVKTQIHHDPNHNLVCVVTGRRRFVLLPPEQVGALYIGPPDRAPPLSLVDPEAPDLSRFPRFAEAMRVARVAHVGPGDALLMPRYWWHHVTSLDPYNAMVNYWWGGAKSGFENPRDLLLAALLTIRRLPAHERDYWRVMFNSHAFDVAGAAMAHLDPAMQGHLGNLGPREQAALRRVLQSAFSRSGG